MFKDRHYHRVVGLLSTISVVLWQKYRNVDLADVIPVTFPAYQHFTGKIRPLAG
jgi:hypothetical protein